MNFVNEIFENIDSPIWIKDRYNKIIFINESFKFNFNIPSNINENNLNEYFKNNISLRKLMELIIELKEKSSSIFELNGKIYKHITFSYDDKFKKIAGMLIDVSDINDNYDIKYGQNILRTVIDNIPDLIFYKDKNLRYEGLNKEAQKFYSERGIDDVIGKTDLELPLDKNFIENCFKHDNIVLETKKPLYIEEDVPIPNSNISGVVQTIKTPIINEYGELCGLVGVVRDITEQKKIDMKLKHLSYTDRLTGLYNRAYFDKKIEEFIESKNLPIGIIIGDVNGLKIVNDILGHIEGDKLLKSISKVLTKACPSKGLVFRWGGDEFIIILPDTSDKECIELINRITALCENEEIYDNFKLSISQGYSLFKENSNIDEVLRKSEAMLYNQKILSNKSFRKSILDDLNKNLQSKNIETKDHIDRVEKYCLEVGKALDLDEETIDKLLLVSKLHDIGKIGIPENILLKKDALTNYEYEIVKTHSEKGYRLAISIPELSHISRCILTHHERWDGSGYPLGLKGEDIPLIARIVAVVDSFDVMTNDRVYSKAKTINEAIKELRDCAGTQFDPNIVDIFCEIINKLE